MEKRLSKAWLLIAVLMFFPMISKAGDITLTSRLENATVTFYTLEDNGKGSEITTVTANTEYVLADIQPNSGYWTGLNMLNGAESLADIGSANARRKAGSPDQISLARVGTIEAFGEIKANGGGLYKLGIVAPEGIKSIVLDGTLAEQIDLSGTSATIGGVTYQINLNYGETVFGYTGNHQAPHVTAISLSTSSEEPVYTFDVETNLNQVLKNSEETEITESKDKGSYSLVINGKNDGCFKASKEIAYSINGISITKATATITAPKTGESLDKIGSIAIEPETATEGVNMSIVYDNENPEKAASGTAYKATITLTSSNGSYSFTSGTEVEIASAESLANKAVSADGQTLTIDATFAATEQIVVKVKSVSRKYGEDNPANFEYEVSGGTIEGEPVISTEATSESPVGSYAISITKGSITTDNVELVSGTLTIEPALLTITAENKQKTYGEDNPTLTYVCSGFVNSEGEGKLTTKPNLSTTVNKESTAGTYPITISGAAADNYTISYVNGTFIVEVKTTTNEGISIENDGENITLSNVNDDAIATDGGLTIPDNVTQIDNEAFSNITKEDVEYVDLSNTSVTGITVDRDNGLFNGFSDNTLIYLPSGNTANSGEPNVVIDGTCEKLVLSDDEGMEIPTGFNASSVTYNRTLTAAKAGTICLPYNLTSDATVGYYQLSSSTAEALVFTEVATTTANEPYLVVSKTAGASLSKSLSTAISSNKNLNAETGITGYKMVGTMKTINHTSSIGKYILQDDNKWHKVTSESDAAAIIGAYHAYIENTTGGAARLAIVLEGNDGMTALKSIQTVDADGTERWYDLNGRRLESQPTQKGAYIVNGKKVVK